MSSSDRIEKDLKDLDVSQVDFENGHWSWGRGGYPHEDHEYSICYVDDSPTLVQTRYKLPECLNEMLSLQYKFGYNQAKNDIKHALNKTI